MTTEFDYQPPENPKNSPVAKDFIVSTDDIVENMLQLHGAVVKPEEANPEEDSVVSPQMRAAYFDDPNNGNMKPAEDRLEEFKSSAKWQENEQSRFFKGEPAPKPLG